MDYVLSCVVLDSVSCFYKSTLNFQQIKYIQYNPSRRIKYIQFQLLKAHATVSEKFTTQSPHVLMSSSYNIWMVRGRLTQNRSYSQESLTKKNHSFLHLTMCLHNIHSYISEYPRRHSEYPRRWFQILQSLKSRFVQHTSAADALKQ